MEMKIYRAYWWKVLAALLVFYTLIAGFLIEVPRIPIINESIRNQFFHVPMWFAMVILLTVSLVAAIKYLINPAPRHDLVSTEMTYIALALGIAGILTGSVWARFTWGDWWVNDPKLNGAAITILIYLAYAVLRSSLEDPDQRARIAAVYNIFAFSAMVPLLFILPRLTDSLHPGNGGNPGFNIYDMNNTLRMVFYPAVLGWTLLGVWIASLRIRSRWLTGLPL